MTDTPQEAEFRRRLIEDYDRLINDFTAAYERRGATFGMWLTGEQGRLTIAALETARKAVAAAAFEADAFTKAAGRR